MNNTTTDLLQQAKQKMAEDMNERGIGAIIWNIAEAGFHVIPELVISDNGDTAETMRVTGLYSHEGKLYAIEEDLDAVNMHRFYREGIDVAPVVVTLTPDKAMELLGDPEGEAGFTTAGTLEEWIGVADCYFEALAE